MAAGNWVFTNGARTAMLNGNLDFDTDVFKMALGLSTCNIAATVTNFSAMTGQVVSGGGNGYTAGGITVSFTLSGTAAVMVDISSDPVWTGVSSGFSARYAIIYEAGGVSDIVCWCPLDSASADVTVAAGNTLTVAANTSGVFILS